MSDPSLCLEWKSQGGNATTPAPLIVICLLTYQRTAMALRTIQGVVEHLDYPQALRTWYIADDGSPSAHTNAIFEEMSKHGETLAGWHSDKFRRERTPYCGKGWNVALQKAHALSDFVLWLEDDWVLKRDLDLRPFAWLLMDRQDVGMVSFRGLSAGLRTEVACHRGLHYLRVERSGKDAMAYSGHPLLRHARYLRDYGLFSTNNTPGDLEIACDNRYRAYPGCDIWWPIDVGGWGIWGHIGENRTW